MVGAVELGLFVGAPVERADQNLEYRFALIFEGEGDPKEIARDALRLPKTYDVSHQPIDQGDGADLVG